MNIDKITEDLQARWTHSEEAVDNLTHALLDQQKNLELLEGRIEKLLGSVRRCYGIDS